MGNLGVYRLLSFVGLALSLIPACFIASANYILNEILDAPFDALHPTKKLRGVPAGKVSVPILWKIHPKSSSVWRLVAKCA